MQDTLVQDCEKELNQNVNWKIVRTKENGENAVPQVESIYLF